MQELTPAKILEAYRIGRFPMGNPHDNAIDWYDPDPRTILPLDGLKISKSLRQRCRSGRFAVSTDRHFEEVIDGCAEARPRWISAPIREAYTALHRLGHAHSVEATREGRVVGGLYGVRVGGAFMGESMFHRETDAGKVCMVALVSHLRRRGFVLLDSQTPTPITARLGAVLIPRAEYLDRLARAIRLSPEWGPPGTLDLFDKTGPALLE